VVGFVRVVFGRYLHVLASMFVDVHWWLLRKYDLVDVVDSLVLVVIVGGVYILHYFFRIDLM